MADLRRSSWLTAQGAVGSPQLVSLPELKLPEELLFLLWAQSSAARCLLALSMKRKKIALSSSKLGAATTQVSRCSHCSTGGKRRQPESSAMMLTSHHFG